VQGVWEDQSYLSSQEGTNYHSDVLDRDLALAGCEAEQDGEEEEHTGGEHLAD
jgi:hypothetical protein